MPYTIVLEFGKKLSGALLVKMLDTIPAAGCNNLEFLWVILEKPGHERASVAFKMPKHTDLVGKALLGLGTTEGFVDAPIVADANLCPQGILDLVHAGAKMAHEENQASPEAGTRDPIFRL